MNKLIRQLTGEATASVPDGKSDFFILWELAFYQLIVHECMDVVLQNNPSTTKTVDPIYGEVIIAIGDHFFRIDEILGNPVVRVAQIATEYCKEEYKDHAGSTAWLWEEKFARIIIEECMDEIYGCDPSEQMMAHEPYTTMTDHVYNHFYGDDESV